MAQVCGVAAEQLVRALSREHDFHVLTRGLRQEIRWQDGGIADRLGERVGDGLERPLERRLVRRDHVVHGADVVGHGLGV